LGLIKDILMKNLLGRDYVDVNFNMDTQSYDSFEMR